VSTDRQNASLLVVSGLVDQVHQLIDLSLLPKWPHAPGEYSDELTELFGADHGSSLIDDHLERPTVGTTTARELLAYASRCCWRKTVFDSEQDLQRKDRLPGAASSITYTLQRDLAKPREDIRARFPVLTLASDLRSDGIVPLGALPLAQNQIFIDRTALRAHCMDRTAFNLFQIGETTYMPSLEKYISP